MSITKSITIHKLSSQGETLVCPFCGDFKQRIEPALPPHHQKLVCNQCDRFIKWLPSPQSIQRSEEIKDRVKALKINQNKLSKWDAGFIDSLWLNCCRADLENKLIKLSPRQAEQLKRIEDENSSPKNISSDI